MSKIVSKIGSGEKLEKRGEKGEKGGKSGEKGKYVYARYGRGYTGVGDGVSRVLIGDASGRRGR